MQQQRTAHLQRTILAVLLVLFVFQPLLATIVKPFQYWDEIYAFMAFPLLIYTIYRNGYELPLRSGTVALVALLALFSVMGAVGNVLYHYQPLSAVMLDWFLHMKFFLTIAVTYMLFQGGDADSLYQEAWAVCRGIVIVLFAMTLLDMVFGIFPATVRLGMRAEALFYGAPASLAFISFFLIALLFKLYQYVGVRIIPYLCMMLLIAASTLRAKAIGGCIFALFLYFVIVRQKRSFGVFSLLGIAAGMALGAYQQLSYYYLTDNMVEARKVLSVISLRIAKNNFPFGTGFATFGSAYSADPYSRVYYLYHINRIWGLSPKEPMFISDTFWPMLLGQSGFFATVVFILILVVLFLRCFKVRKQNAYSYASALMVWVYLLVSSTSESAFVNPVAVPLGMILGLIFLEQSRMSQPTIRNYQREKEIV